MMFRDDSFDNNDDITTPPKIMDLNESNLAKAKEISRGLTNPSNLIMLQSGDSLAAGA